MSNVYVIVLFLGTRACLSRLKCRLVFVFPFRLDKQVQLALVPLIARISIDLSLPLEICSSH